MKVHRCFRSVIFIDRRHIYILLSILHKKISTFSSFGLWHRPDPSRHALDEVSAQLCGHVENPGWLDGLNKRWKTAWMLLSNSILQFCPEFSSGHSNNLIFFVLRKSVTIFARWHGAPSCINISQSCTAMCNSNFSFINSKYFLPFMVVPDRGRIGRPFFGLKSLPKSSHSAGVSWFAVWIFIVPSSWWSPHSSLPRVKLLNCCFVGKQNSGPFLDCPVFVFFRKLQALQLHCRGQSRFSGRFPWLEAEFAG